MGIDATSTDGILALHVGLNLGSAMMDYTLTKPPILIYPDVEEEFYRIVDVMGEERISKLISIKLLIG